MTGISESVGPKLVKFSRESTVVMLISSVAKSAGFFYRAGHCEP